MNKIELGKRLFEMTVDDLKQLIPEEDAVSTGIMKLDLAAKTRRAIHAVQIEDMWQEFNDEIKDFATYLELKLSHMTLCSVLSSNQDLNGLQWQLIIRRLDSFSEDMRPTALVNICCLQTRCTLIISTTTTWKRLVNYLIKPMSSLGSVICQDRLIVQKCKLPNLFS